MTSYSPAAPTARSVAWGPLKLKEIRDAELFDGQTVVVVHGVPTVVGSRCGVELFDEEATRTPAAFYEHAANGRSSAM